MKHCSIMQPTYLPWLGYFDMMDKVDLFVFYDDVQLTKPSWQVRNKIRSSNGELWLTIPVLNKDENSEGSICETKIDYRKNWVKKHLKSIFYNYQKAIYFDEVYPIMESVLTQRKENLADLNIDIILYLAEAIGISTQTMRSSQIDGLTGSKDDRLISLLNKVDYNTYLSPRGASGYINQSKLGGNFKDKNIELYYHNYSHPVYHQVYGDFIPFMSILDLLFNVGLDKSLQVIRSGRQSNIYFDSL